MPTKRESFNANPDVRRKNAQDQVRDEFGHFIKTKTTVRTPLDIPSNSQSSASTDDNIVDVKVKNPLSKITKILEDIKRHQNTNFAIKVSVPLIALPVFLFIVFQLGRAQTTCAQNYVSKIGTLEIISVEAPKPKGLVSYLFSFFPRIPSITPEDELEVQVRPVLLTSDAIIHVIQKNNIDLLPYKGKNVLITGNYSACSSVLALDSLQNVVRMER